MAVQLDASHQAPSFAIQHHPQRACAITLFAIAIILFSIGLSLGIMGLATHQNALPLWLKSTVNTLGKEGSIGVLAGGYVSSGLLGPSIQKLFFRMKRGLTQKQNGIECSRRLHVCQELFSQWLLTSLFYLLLVFFC